MLHRGTFGVFALYIFGALQCTPQVKWTLFTKGKSWNEAQLVCWTMGGKLAMPDTPEDKGAMDNFINNEPWKSKAGILTLFLDMAEVPGTGIRWSNCDEVLNVWQMSFDPTPDMCAGVLPNYLSTNQKISTAECHAQTRLFICEVEESPTCPYETVSGLPTISGSEQSSIHGDAACQQFCNGVSGCRGYVYETSCKTYNDDNPMVFEGGSNIDTGQTGLTKYKVCYLTDMVETVLDFTSPTSFTPFPFKCGSNDPPTTVYTVLSDPKSWSQAIACCASLNASLAVLDTQTKFEVVQALLDDPSLRNHWVGYQEINNTHGAWTTGEILSGVTPEDPSNIQLSCGTTDLLTGEHKYYNCDTQLPYVCQHSMGQCHFAVTRAYSSQSGYVNHGVMSMEDCYNTCESNRNTSGGHGCYAFVTKHPSISSNKECHTMDFDSWEKSFTTADTWITSNSEKSIWRYTCITVALDNYNKVEPPTTTPATTSTSTTTTDATTYTSTATTPSSTMPSITTTTTAISTTTTTTAPATTTTTTPATTTTTTTTTSPSTTSSPTTQTASSSSTTTTISPPPTSTASSSIATTTSPPTTSTASSSSSTTTTQEPMTTITTSNSTSDNTTLMPTNATPFLCRCPCLGNLSYPDPDEFLDELASLHVPAESTSAAYRKKNSIMDNRQESKGIGTVACLFLASVIGIIVTFDVMNYCLLFKTGNLGFLS